MNRASWEHVAQGDATLEKNWLFTLRRERFRSTRSGSEHDYYVVDLADSVNVVAITSTNLVILVRQFRAGSRSDSLETPGGLLGPGEDPREAGARELLEETGFAGDPPIVLGTCWANPSILTARATTILITNAECVAMPKPDPNEELRVDFVSAWAIPRALREGRIHHALSVWSLMLWLVSELPRSPWAVPRPRRRWQFRIRTIMAIVLATAILLAISRALGPVSFASMITLLGGILLPLWLMIFHWRERSVLLIESRWGAANASMLAFASIGAMVLGFVLTGLLVSLFRML